MTFGRAAQARSASPSVSPDADFEALAVLRTLHGKLVYAVETDPQAIEQMNLVLDSRPPDGGGTLGGNDLTITPANLDIANRALASGGEAWIAIEPVAPAEWRSETETGRSVETVGKLISRVDAAIERILARVLGKDQIVGAEVADASAAAAPPGGVFGWLIPIGMMAGAVLLIKRKLEPMMAKHNKSMRRLGEMNRRR